MFDGDDDDDDHDDCASTTTTSPSSSSPDYDDDDDVEILLDRSRTLIVKAKDAECKCSCANREECNGQSGSEEKANDVGRNYDQMSSSSSALRNGGDWKVKEWKAGDNSMTSSSSPLPPLPPLHPPVTDDLESCQSSMTSFVAASQSRRDASSSSESREELSLLCQQRSSICGSTTGEKPSRCQRRRHGRPLDCAAGKSNPASDEQKAPVPWRANARCQQVVAPCRPPPPPQLRSFLSEMADRRCPVINIRRATLYVNSRIGFNREKGKSNGQSTTTTKDLAPRQKNRRSDRPKTNTEIQPGPGSFRCHRAPPPRLPSLLRSLELDGDSRYPSPSSPSSASPYPRPSPVSDDLPVERAPEEERVGGNAASSEKSDWKKEKKKEEEDEEEESEKCSFKRMLDLTIVCLIVAVVLLSIFSYVFGPSKTKDSDPC